MTRIYFLRTRSPSNRLNIWHLMKWEIGIVDMLLTNLLTNLLQLRQSQFEKFSEFKASIK